MIDVSEFEPLLFLQRNWPTIAAESKMLCSAKRFYVSGEMSREDVAHKLITEGPQWVCGWDGHDKWRNWGIAINYQYLLGDAGLPKTSALLKQVSGIRFANLSLFNGGCMLPVHAHPENKGLLTFHLGLDVPEECYLNVNGENIQEENGKTIVFDGMLPHYSFNASSKDRLILYCEFDHEKLKLAN